MDSGEVATCFLLVRKFLMQEMNVRHFLIKGWGETCQGMGHGGARAAAGGKAPWSPARKTLNQDAT